MYISHECYIIIEQPQHAFYAFCLSGMGRGRMKLLTEIRFLTERIPKFNYSDRASKFGQRNMIIMLIRSQINAKLKGLIKIW